MREGKVWYNKNVNMIIHLLSRGELGHTVINSTIAYNSNVINHLLLCMLFCHDCEPRWNLHAIHIHVQFHTTLCHWHWASLHSDNITTDAKIWWIHVRNCGSLHATRCWCICFEYANPRGGVVFDKYKPPEWKSFVLFRWMSVREPWPALNDN